MDYSCLVSDSQVLFGLQLPERVVLLTVPVQLLLSNNPGRVDVVGLDYTAESWT